MLSAGTEHLLQGFIILSGLLLIPVVLGVIVILFKIAFLLHSLSDLLRLASYDLPPLIKEIHRMVDQLEEISERAATSVQELGASFDHAVPLIRKGVSRLQAGTSALVSGIGRSFDRPQKSSFQTESKE